MQRDLWNIVYQARPEDLRDLQTQLLQNNRQPLSDAIAGWMSGFVAPRPTTPQAGPTSIPANAAPSGYAPPNYSGYQPQNYSQPSYSQPTYTPPANNYAPPTGGYSSAPSGYAQPTQAPVPPPLANGPQSQQDQLLSEISRAFSGIPPVQLQVQADIRQKLNGVPPDVTQSVLEDWRRDLWQPRLPDPDPTTNASTTLEQRIVRQLQSRGIPVNRLSSEVQNRLDDGALR